ncbi:DUF6090 family protein [Formosa maritima]|uniref:Uncharacterized protein n=1 Tax=Formosa maritima TaxID=2592046 RepID=A0A5D0GPR0_9FLAO|nr:DUF6090 family protein [Formosa maritima]TYA59667.1 hypothetical protein FVF61_01035 [Formosa maritima]
MIKFFRKIRYNLMEQNKTGKYLKYAFGEIILVVIGILIALQINSWNEQRKQNIAEKEFLQGIKNDLVQDKQFIDIVLSRITPKIKAYNMLNKDSLILSRDKPKIDSLLKIYLNLGQRTFYPISGSYQAAISGNEINRYTNKQLVQPIIKLYNSTYERLIDNGKILDERWSYLSKIYIHERRTGQYHVVDTIQFSKLLDDFHFHFIQMEWYKNVLDNAIIEIDELLIKIDMSH